MEVHVTAGELREDLTRLSRRARAGHSVIIEGRTRPRMVFRAYRNGDRGKTISITRFRRDLHRILREIPSRPAIVTVDGWVEYWVGVLGERPAAQRPTPDPWPGEHR